MFHRTGPSKGSSHVRQNESLGIRPMHSADDEDKMPPYSPQSKKRQCFHNKINGVFLRLRQFFATASLLKVVLCLISFYPLFISLSRRRIRTPSDSAFSLYPANQLKIKRYKFDQPRVLQVDSSFHTVQRPLQQKTKASDHMVEVSSRAKRAKKEIADSVAYKKCQRDPLHEGDCEPMRWWQETSFPTCNKMHEKRFELDVDFLTDGGYNSIFRMADMDHTIYILKILQYETRYTDRNYDRVRRDSLLMERATASKYIMDIYSFCGFTQVVEYGKHGNLEDILWKIYDTITQEQKLQIATQVAQALADIQDLDGDGISSMSHGDFATKQYIMIDGILKLNDFNRGRFIRWNPKLKEPCTYTIGANDAKFRAPEEYQYVPETAAIDIWALGSIFVELVTGYGVWHGYETEDAQKRIAKGKLPNYQKRIENAADPINEILVKAIDMCWIYEPKDRPKAGAVAGYLKAEAKKRGIDWETRIFAKQGNTEKVSKSKTRAKSRKMKVIIHS